MVDSRFSQLAFQSAGFDTPEAGTLVSLLQHEIMLEMDSVVRERFCDIICRLNDMGHNLRAYTPLVPGELSFRDDSGSEGTDSYVCRLRVAIDYLVSAGYPHLTYEEDEETKTGEQQVGTHEG